MWKAVGWLQAVPGYRWRYELEVETPTATVAWYFGAMVSKDTARNQLPA